MIQYGQTYLLSDFSLITGFKQRQVARQLTLIDDFIVAFFVERRAKNDVFIFGKSRVYCFYTGDGFVGIGVTNLNSSVHSPNS